MDSAFFNVDVAQWHKGTSPSAGMSYKATSFELTTSIVLPQCAYRQADAIA